MTDTLIRARVVGASAGWSVRRLGPDGEPAFRRPIPGSGVRVPIPQYDHHVAFRGQTVEIPAADFWRLHAAGAVVEDPDGPLEGTTPGARARAQAPAKAPAKPQAPEASDVPQGAAQDAEGGLVPQPGGYYLLPNGERVRGKAAAEAALAQLRGV